MDSMESCVPPGFRFHPTDEELVGYYLKKKVASQKIDLDVIRDIDLYRIEPWDLQERCRIGYEEQSEWYFFSHKDKKYPTGTRTNRATLAGFWKATGRDKAVHDKGNLIGMRKTLVFYKGRAPNGQKTDWIMHEYRLESEENAPPQEEGWVVCRAFKKRTTNTQPRSTVIIDPWDSTYCFVDESIACRAIPSLPDPIETLLYKQQQRRQQQPKDLYCKQEAELEALNSIYTNSFIQLPQLESPSLPLMNQQPSNIDSKNYELEKDHVTNVTDWRELDKFVASQLSHENRPGPEQELEPVFSAGFGSEGEPAAEMAAGLLLFQEGSGLGELVLRGDRICVFEK